MRFGLASRILVRSLGVILAYQPRFVLQAPAVATDVSEEKKGERERAAGSD